MKQLTLEQLAEICPNILTEEKGSSRSSKYVQIPTITIIKDIMEMGWVPVSAKIVKSRKKDAAQYKKHLVQFEHSDFTTPEHNVQLLLTNSHDGTSNFKLDLGVFRLICSNGLVIKSEDFGSMKIRHMGYEVQDVIDAVNKMVSFAPVVLKKIDIMKEATMTDEEMLEFALKSACIRFDKDFGTEATEMKKHIDLMQLLNVIRPEDEGNNVWNVYNRVQEKIIAGDFTYTNEKHKVRKGRKIKNMDRDIKINQQLWELADGYLN